MALIGHVRALRVLTEVARCGTFSDAARALGITQSAASQHVTALEREAGLTLLDRGTRPLELTEAGRVLARSSTAIQTQLEDAQQSLDELVGRSAGRLRLGSFPTALTSFVPHALQLLRSRHRGLQLTVIDDHMPALLPRLETGELDMAVIYEQQATSRGRGRGPVIVPLFDDPYRVLLPARHRLAGFEEPLRLADLRGEDWVGGRAGSAWFRILLLSCRRAGFEPQTLLATDDHRAVHAFVAAGLGIGVVPGLAAEHAPRGVVVRDLRDAPLRRISVAHRRGEPVTDPMRTAIETLQQVTATS